MQRSWLFLIRREEFTIRTEFILARSGSTKKKRLSCWVSDSKSVSNEDILETDCTILIPAALENQITKKNAAKSYSKNGGRSSKQPFLKQTKYSIRTKLW